MSDISKELNSILNDEKTFEKEEKSPALFITLIIFFIAVTYFTVFYFSMENKTIEKNTQFKNIEKEKSLEKKKELIKEKIITKIDRNNFYKIYSSNNVKSINCYDYKPGEINPTLSCLNNLKIFSKENQKALRFQIITVIGNNDINIYKKFKKNIQDLILNGLSIKRISEISWNIKKELGNDIIITSNNYYVESKNNKHGIILKAYY